MLNQLTASIIDGTLTVNSFLLCTAASLLLGLGVAGVYMFKNRYSKGFVATLVLLPAMVQVVIMLVNGNIGAGVAVAGAFSLIRFRSVPGSARDISSIFFAMAVGLATGMGYIFYAAAFFLVVGAASIVLALVRFGEPRQIVRKLRITIPENLDYEGLFDDLFEQYARSSSLEKVRLTNMGSLYELTYNIDLKTTEFPKDFIDRIRERNGNLNIILARVDTSGEEL